jgi:hypothetical protein
VRSILHFCGEWPRTAHLKSQISELKSLCESCSRQIRGWADSLQNTEIRGQRHLTDQSRAHFQQKLEAEKFLRHLDEIRRAATEPPKPPSS